MCRTIVPNRRSMITVIGDALVNLVPVPGESVLRARPGGTGFDTAVSAARLGHPTALMARLSRDPFGQILRGHAARGGVDLSACPEADEPTMIAVAAGAGRDAAGSLYFHGTATWQWTSAELSLIPAGTTVLHVDSLACCVAPGSTRILRASARQRGRGAIVCLSVAVAPAVLESPARGRLLVDRTFRSADVVRARVEDIAWLYPGRSPEAVAQMWLARGPRLAVITRGAEGVVAIRDSGAVLHRPARPASPRADGLDPAFDPAFTGALLGGLHQFRRSGQGIDELTTGDLASMLDAAVAPVNGVPAQSHRASVNASFMGPARFFPVR
jgi:fructokinase